MNNRDIAASAQIAPDARLDAPRVTVGAGAQVLPGVVLSAAEEIRLAPGAVIGRNASLRAAHITIGHGTRLGDECALRAQRGRPADEIRLGDFSLLERGANVLAQRFVLGDYVSIFQNLYVAGGRAACVIGHNCWIGQDTILDANEALTLGDNVRIGTRSQLWTHVASGELLEGCTLFGRRPLVVEDNVWIVGGAVISPGLVLRQGSIVMVGAVVTKSTQPRHCYAGVPAQDVSDKLQTYQALTDADKWQMLGEFLAEFAAEAEGLGYAVTPVTDGFALRKDGHEFQVLRQAEPEALRLAAAKVETLVFTQAAAVEPGNPLVSIFSLQSKRYTKRRSTAERLVITFLNGYRARFVPVE